MLEEKSNILISSKKSATNLFLSFASLGAGAYHGYCDASGIPFEKENTEWVLTYGPMVARGVVRAVKVGSVGLVGGSAFGTGLGAVISEKLSGALVGAGTGAVAGTAVGVGIGGTMGAVKGGLQTLIGYGIGYVVGFVAR